MKLAIAGGTGTVGTLVTDEAHRAGHTTTVLSRSHGVDLTTGEGLDLTGVDAVIDVTGVQASSSEESRGFFGTVTRTLLQAEQRAGVKHHLALSIIGAAQSPHGYYAGKALQEELVMQGEVPWTVLRTTQFFEFAEQMSTGMGPITIIPRVISQPVAASSVASRLVALAEAGASQRVHELAGPARMRMAELLRMILKSRGEAGPVVEFRLPGKFGTMLRSGLLLPGPEVELDTVTVAEWLET